ncbi:MAG TPA: LysM peptidoglycan-binding domain-containing protein [Nevskiaceae bacterium]|nr:LysM peptidoglycan-binding domain-containing protein [Nevskiaceae bacterium]
MSRLGALLCLAVLALASPPRAAAAPVTADDPDFPRYERLKPAIAFWTDVFGQYSEHQSVIHSSVYPGKVFEVIDLRAEAARLDKPALARLRAEREKAAKARIDRLLAEVHARRGQPEQLDAEQRRVWELFRDIKGDDRYREAIGSFRAQRGLKERTRQALEISGKYLPEMEAIFTSYGLPVALTRLPLVESSFNVEAYSKVGAAGLWQFMPASAKIYMRLNEVVDDRRDPWASTHGAAKHLRDDYAMLGAWPLALTAYNHGRGGVSRGLQKTGGRTLMDLIDRYQAKSFGFASRNFYAEFLAASDVEREWRRHFGEDLQRRPLLRYETVETRHYVPYETLRRLCGADDELFRKLNPAYRPEVMDGKLYVPPGHLIRVPAGSAEPFSVAYAKLGDNERFSSQRVYFLQHRVSRGETLGRIASRYGVSVKAIQSASGLKNAGSIRIGQLLKIPPREEARPGPVTVAVGESKPGLTREETRAAEQARQPVRNPRVHKVRAGQTLSSIAKQYRVSVASLRDANALGSSSHIRAGQRLTIPAS